MAKNKNSAHRLYVLLGKSASGKDTIFKELIKNDKIILKRIVPYTTRPERNGEKKGTDYNFTDEKGLAELEKQGIVIEKRVYNTVEGVWTYFTVDDGRLDFKNSDYIMISTPQGFLKIREYYKKKGIETVPVYIYIDDGVRLQRALKREKRQDKPKYAEMCRRFLADSEDFSEEMLEKCGIGKGGKYRAYSSLRKDAFRKIIKDMVNHK